MSLNQGMELDGEEILTPQPEQSEPVKADITQDVAAIQAAQSAIQDLAYLKADVNKAGMSQQFALEAERIHPGFLSDSRLLKFFTLHPSKVQLAASLEEFQSWGDELLATIRDGFSRIESALRATGQNVDEKTLSDYGFYVDATTPVNPCDHSQAGVTCRCNPRLLAMLSIPEPEPETNSEVIAEVVDGLGVAAEPVQTTITEEVVGDDAGSAGETPADDVVIPATVASGKVTIVPIGEAPDSLRDRLLEWTGEEDEGTE